MKSIQSIIRHHVPNLRSLFPLFTPRLLHSTSFRSTCASSTACDNKQRCASNHESFNSDNLKQLSTLFDSRQPFHTMSQPFYLSPLVYRSELEFLWRKAWLFAGYTCQLVKEGDYFTFEIGDDSIIIMKGSGGVRAFHNVCRHRGSRLVIATSSTLNKKALVCPYHAWAYDQNGKLKHAGHMADNDKFDKDKYGLHAIHCEVLHGLIFICLSPLTSQPLYPFEPAANYITPQLRPHGIDQAKIAYTQIYKIDANWKLIYENNRECYHCAGTHPEYIRSNYDLFLTYHQQGDGTYARDLDDNYPNKDKILAHMARMSAQWSSVLGVQCSPGSHFPDDGWYRCSRMPLREGWSTESLDGNFVSTAMGTLPRDNMGSMRIHTLPNYWMHASCDHAVSSRLRPLDAHTTEVRVDWLVDARAAEGRDYHLEKLLPFWAKTSDQDWMLCEANMNGVRSSAYAPGPLSVSKESGLERWIQWYITWMKNEINKKKKQLHIKQ